MDMMEVRRRVMLSMASGAKIFKGIYISESDVTNISVDVGISNFTHFLLLPHTLPYDTRFLRCLGGRYVDLEQRIVLIMVGSSKESNIPSQTNVFTDDTSTVFDYIVGKEGSTIEMHGIASQVGVLRANTQYDWYAW